ncbi:AAA family ATPase [Mitsuaria sp. GD03876]|uniref:AAA family ATPase n=1 Tax=Mitsuaria sp. GD03876 TaxID=2975399 RepID=UPI00244D2FE2|nr:AAA family ATPase [Mitsuaria sp. GD03876]MDH0864522.1 AAA family ATPase [Mitsuaria sp. GD03876]
MDDPRAPLSLRFGPFAFDEANARLMLDGRALALAPKAFGVLAELLRHAGQLVTKDALLDSVWGHRHVSESVLKTTISELRAVLGDDAKSPRWVETASRRGYRFIGPIDGQAASAAVGAAPTAAWASVVAPRAAEPEAATAATRAPPAFLPAADDGLIGRQTELDRLRGAWSRAAGGQRQLCCVAGEAGIGKTALIDAFVASLGDAATAHGQCIEQVGEGEPYLPVLDALAGLARSDATLVAQLRRVAPTWLLQLPWLIDRDEQERLQAGLASSTQDRMLREFSELVEQLTAARPLLLITEDLHWCDEATVRLIDHVARRRPPARLMWLATYRTPELVANDHPLNGLRHELRARRLCEELLLDPFSETELAAYLARHRPGLVADEAHVRRLHRQTDGLPLFVANAVDELSSSTGAAAGEAPSDDWAVPDSLAGVIERQRARLAPEAVTLLEAAAVCGVEFECSVVAGMLGHDAAAVAADCEELARRQAWLAPSTLETLADGSLEARFTFRHALYRQALYQRIAPSARVGLHRRAAAALGQLRADRIETIAAALALHHERGLDALAAMGAYAAAGERALGRFAPREALLLVTRGLALLERCPDGEARCEAELALQQLRGAALAQSTGVTTPGGRAAYLRCAELCELLPPTQPRAWVMTGLVWMFTASGEYQQAEAIALRLCAAADAFDDDLLRAAGAVSLAVTLLQRGRIQEVMPLVRRARALTEALGHPRLPPMVLHDPSSLALGVGAVSHAYAGEVDIARSWAEAGTARATQIGLPVMRGFAARCANLVDVRFERAEAVLARTQRMRELVREHQLGQGEGPSRAMLGWARARTGDATGLREVEEGCAAHAATGAWFEASGLRWMAADAALAVGDLAEARRHLDDGFAMAERFGETLHLPDLWTARAALAAREGDSAGAREAAGTAARLAREQGALTAELVARLALCELPGASPADVDALRALRARWHDTTPWPALARVDALLSADA